MKKHCSTSRRNSHWIVLTSTNPLPPSTIVIKSTSSQSQPARWHDKNVAESCSFFFAFVLLYIYFITLHCCHCPSLPFLCATSCSAIVCSFFCLLAIIVAALICWLCTVVHNATPRLTWPQQQFGNRRKVLPRRGGAEIHRLGPATRLGPLFHTPCTVGQGAKLGGNLMFWDFLLKTISDHFL